MFVLCYFNVNITLTKRGKLCCFGKKEGFGYKKSLSTLCVKRLLKVLRFSYLLHGGVTPLDRA